MTIQEVALHLVKLCREGKNLQAIQELYSPQIVSVEAFEMPPMPRTTTGMAGVLKKSQWWVENHIVHSAKVGEPFVAVEKFAVTFDYDVTFKPTGKRTEMKEVGVYTVAGGKITHEEFLYAMS